MLRVVLQKGADMTKEFYEKITAPFRRHPAGVKGVILTDKILTRTVYIAYPVFLISLCITRNPMLSRAIAIPALTLWMVTRFRMYYDAGRPYELLDIKPLIQKDTVRHSYPSRHVFSIFILAMTFYAVYPVLGILTGIAGIVLAIVRVIGGVHFPKDVVAGAVLGIFFGILAYFPPWQ